MNSYSSFFSLVDGWLLITPNRAVSNTVDIMDKNHVNTVLRRSTSAECLSGQCWNWMKSMKRRQWRRWQWQWRRGRSRIQFGLSCRPDTSPTLARGWRLQNHTLVGNRPCCSGERAFIGRAVLAMTTTSYRWSASTSMYYWHLYITMKRNRFLCCIN